MGLFDNLEAQHPTIGKWDHRIQSLGGVRRHQYHFVHRGNRQGDPEKPVYRSAYWRWSVKFSDGTAWTRQDLINAANAATTFGTTGNDNITGTGGPNIFDGKGSTDYINGNDGNDTFRAVHRLT
jgi:Ca2+-binding RTX toxin-like protein